MIKDLSDAQKLDILLSFKRKGYSLQDTDDPAVMKMSLGTGYTLFANIRDSWIIEFDDGVEKARHNIESPKIPFTNAKDALRLEKEYVTECKRVLAEKRGEFVPEQKAPDTEVVDLEEKIRILEALENGEIQKPDSTPKETPVQGPGPTISNPKMASWEEEQQKKILERKAEEKARLEREENIRRLEELERLEQAESELEAKKALDEAKKAKVPAESSGNGQSKTPLLDMIHSYVGNDVLEIFGETGSGKSKFALTVAKEAVAAGKKVFYLDTERNLTESDIRDLKGCEYKYTPIIDEIDSIAQNLPNVDVVILDSIGFPVLTTFARMSVKQKGDALLKLIAIFGDLKAWAYKNNGVVVVTNQPESEFNKGPNHILRPFGDKSQFAAKEIWETKFMDRKPACTKSRISAFRSRSVGHGTRIADMEISSGGVEVI